MSDVFHTVRRGGRIYARRITGTKLWVILVYKDSLLEGSGRGILLLCLLTLFSVVLAILLYYSLRKNLFVPLKQTTMIMENIRTNSVSEIPEVESQFQEFTDIRDTLAGMVDALKAQKIRTYEEQEEKQRVQLQYLAMQLKPHFYLNSLKTLDALIFSEEPEKAHDLILDLSACLRYLLNSEQEIVTLKEELEFTQKYADMQKYISSRELQYQADCPKELENWPVPRLAVQTFVENSIKYARKGAYLETLIIDIQADELETEKGKLLNISIQDNGVGFSQEYLEWFYKGDWKAEMGIGIHNLIRRCLFIYGEDERLESSIFNDNGARVELVLPLPPGREQL